LLIGAFVGVLIALPRLYHIPVLRHLSYLYLSFIRGTPALVQLFIIYFGLPQILLATGIDMRRTNPLVFVVIAYGMNWGATISEIIRGSVNSVSQQQVEAAYSVGMDAFQVLGRVVLPQALVVAAPNFFNLVFSALKNTSLAFAIGVMDMVARGRGMGLVSNHAFEAYLALGIIYYAVSLVLVRLFSLVEKRLSRYKLA
jgi:L-cystine transport system permease protein